jgi:uncharacterized membrane protein YfcA
MPFALEQMTQGLSIAAQIIPATLNNSSANSGAGVDMKLFRRIMAVVVIGANSGSLVAKLQGATTSGGSFGDITGATATAVTAGSKTLTIELRDDQAGDANRFVKLVLTEGNSANCVCGAVVLGGEAEHKPAKANDIAAVTQRLVV